MASRTSLVLTCRLKAFTAKLVVPLGMTADEAERLKEHIDSAVTDPDDAVKFAAADPSIYPGITE